MKIINKYLLKQLSFVTLSLTVILSGAIWLTQSLRYMDLIITQGISVGFLLKLVMYLIPELLIIILPLALVIALLFTYNKLFTDREFIVMRAIGMTNLHMAKPALWLATFLTLFLYLISLYFLPLSFRSFKELEANARNSTSTFFINEGEFRTLNKMTIYVKEKSLSGKLSGIMVFDHHDPKRPTTYMAEKGWIVYKGQYPKIVMQNGSRQTKNQDGYGIDFLNFKEYTHEIVPKDLKEDNRFLKPSERFIKDLLNPEADLTEAIKIKWKIEAHRRLTSPLSTLVYALVVLSLLLVNDMGQRHRHLLLCASVVFVMLIQVFVTTLLNLIGRLPGAVYFAYAILLGSSFYASYRLTHSHSFSPTRIKKTLR